LGAVSVVLIEEPNNQAVTRGDAMLTHVGQSAARNVSKSTIMKAKLVLVWLAVGLPLFWGVLKQLETVRYLFQ
jgi:hypothetical protein